MGRPSDFTPEIADVICERVAEGESVRSISRDPEMPAMSTIFKWLADHKSFSEQYARACDVRFEGFFEDTQAKADTAEIQCKSMTQVMGRRLAIEQARWSLARMSPKKYGDKLDLNHGGEVAVAVTDARDELAERLSKLAATQSS